MDSIAQDISYKIDSQSSSSKRPRMESKKSLMQESSYSSNGSLDNDEEGNEEYIVRSQEVLNKDLPGESENSNSHVTKKYSHPLIESINKTGIPDTGTDQVIISNIIPVILTIFYN